MPGVIEIYHRGNVGALYKPSPDAGAIDEARPPFADDVIRYYGQYVAWSSPRRSKMQRRPERSSK